jgi:streptogramin lyase
MTSRSLVLGQLGVLVGASLLAGCGGIGDGGRADSTETATSALGVSSTNVSLQALTNSCGASQVQDFFNVTNNGTTPVAVSDISIKMWVDETSAAALVAQISTGGCLTNASGSCVHQVTGVTATPTKFSPACGSDANHQANWEITITSTDHTTLGAGLMWKNVEVALHLGTFANFTPGPAQWYSACLPGTSFASSSEFAVYVAGGLATASTGVPPSCRAPHGGHQLAGEIPPGVGDGTLVGPLPGATPLTVGIGLPLQGNPQAFIQQLYDPTSPNFGKYLTPDQFGANYGATPTDYSNLISFIQTKGLTVAASYSGRHLLMVKGTASAIESAFFVTLNLYKRPDGTTFYAPANEPSLDAPVAVDYISGLDSYAVAVHNDAGGGGGPGGCLPNTSSGSYVGGDFRSIYFPGCTALDGSGQIIGLIETTDFYSAELTDYEKRFFLGSTTVTRVPVPTLPPLPSLTMPCTGVTTVTTGVDCVSSGPVTDAPLTAAQNSFAGEGEAALDVQMAAAMAPKATIRVYEAASGSLSSDVLSMLNAIVNEPAATRPSVVSSSLGWLAGHPDPAVAKVFIQLAAQGQTFVQASGDSGAVLPGNGVPVVFDPIIDSPYMTVVGGTSLTTTGSGVSTTYASETVWNDSAASAAGNAKCNINSCDNTTGICGCNSVGTGGLVNGYVVCQSPIGIVYGPPGTQSTPGTQCASAGFSAMPLPSFQTNLPSYLTSAASALGQFSTTTRMIPDVSLLADQLLAYEGFISKVNATTGNFIDPALFCTGGTSSAAPLWAGVMAMANQQQQSLSLPTIGFANPHLYAAASKSATDYSGLGGAFHDVTAGNNLYSGNTATANSYQAVAGYDMATGLGTPNGLICNPLKVIPPQKCQIIPGAPGVVTEFAIPTLDADPVSITRGTDCNMWFTELSNGKIGSITPAGIITEFPVTGFDPVDSFVINITTGPDDALWFTTQLQLVNHYIGRIDTSGAETFYKLDSLGVQGHSIVAGADGNLWFGTGLNSIGRISIAGARTIFPLGPASPSPGHSDGLTAGPDGNIWFTDTDNGAIGFVKPSGEAVSFGGGSPNTFGPLAITTGPDGNIWFTDFASNQIGRVTLGVFSPVIALSVTEFPITSPNSGPSGIVAGPDGNLWFTEDDAFKIGRMSPAGVMLGEFPIPSPQTGPHLENGIAVGSDGNVWFTEAGTGKIGRITPP